MCAAWGRNISTHAPAGGATSSSDRPSALHIAFLLTPLREGRRNFFTSPFPPSVFLLTPLREGRRAVHRDPVHRPAFLLTPLREGRPQARDRRAEIFNISTHAPAGGATKSPYRLSLRSAISTHAPAGGATISMTKESAAFAISTHAPAGGATGSARLPASVQGSFLLTPLREGRHADGDDCTQTPLISTHAPAGGATAADGPVGIRGLDFYSRPCGRGDFAACLSFCPRHRFLLTPLREGRHSFPVSRYSPFAISTHAPAGGATRPRWKLARSRSTFLLTPLREGRRHCE